MDTLPIELITQQLFLFLTPADVYFLTLTNREWYTKRSYVFKTFKRDLKHQLRRMLPLYNILSPEFMLSGSMVLQLCQGVKWKNTHYNLFMKESVVNNLAVSNLFHDIPLLAVYDSKNTLNNDYPSLLLALYDDHFDLEQMSDYYFGNNAWISNVRLGPNYNLWAKDKINLALCRQSPINNINNLEVDIFRGYYDGESLVVPENQVWNTFSMTCTQSILMDRSNREMFKKYRENGVIFPNSIDYRSEGSDEY